jgi:hypothetical protein
VTTAKPFVEQAVSFLTTTEPALLGQYALGLVTAWYLAPPLLKATAGYLRGYAGEVTAAAALTAVESEVGGSRSVVLSLCHYQPVRPTVSFQSLASTPA